MLENLKGLESYKVFEFFKEMNEIPRGSGNEKAVSDWLVDFAQKRDLEVIQDDALNVIIRKGGTKGYENSPVVVLQGHMDMVCEKNKDTVHDFEKDPIKFLVDGDVLKADGTTLGADNGIAVAYGLALLDSDEIDHPPVELLLTTEEETGMGGALALNPANIKGKMLINIDSEEEGTLLVSCAGGVRQVITIQGEKESIESESVITIQIRGLNGGHSGMDINKERGNANKIMGRILNDISREVEIRVCDINGGSKMNAIPRECDATIAVACEYKENVINIVEEYNELMKLELSGSDSAITISSVEDKAEEAFKLEDTDRIIKMLYLIPNGVQSMSVQIPGLVESSTNIGVCRVENNEVLFESAIRSSVETKKWEIAKKGDTLCELLGAESDYQSAYPAWQYREESRLRECMCDSYEKLTGKKANISAIHAGLECGLFGGKFGAEMDMVSFGPNLHDVHTPKEWVEISSVDRCWSYLKVILKNLK